MTEPSAPSPSPVPQSAVLVLPSTGEFDSRSQRIASGLAQRGHEVTMIARRGEGLPDDVVDETGYRTVRVPAHLPGVPGLPPFGAALEQRVRAVASIAGQRRAALEVAPSADVYHGMAFMGVPIALALREANGGDAIYDAQDIYVSAASLARLPDVVRAPIAWIERGWARKADLVMTANDAYAAVLAHRWGIPKPAVVMNGSSLFDPPEVSPGLFHAELGLPATERIVLYHGGFSPDRGIEQLIDAIAEVPRATLILMGYGTLLRDLEARAADPALGGRVRVLPAVAPADLPRWVASADVAAMPIQPSTLNHRLTTPNKLFEAMAAGVPVLAGDLPGLRSVVTAAGCGLLVDPTDPRAIARGLTEILDAPAPQRAAWKAGGLAAARGRYSWEAQFERLLAAYTELTRRPW